ncbi:MAG: hypothetical protein GY909_04505 [Oligoflexia bacterium]|nr:hypothetical protein [Oligoflexia bacterium]
MKVFILSLMMMNLAHARLPVIMVDENGVERVETLSKESYQKSFTYILNQANEAASGLNGQESLAGSSYKLSKFSLGLGLEGKIGLGPWDLGLALKQRFIFKRDGKK